jgi:uncharacterized protein
MNLEQIKILLLKVLQKYAIKKAAIFGSFARGEQTETSDLDVLIESSSPITLFDILKIEKEISNLISRKVDVVEFSAIKNSIKENVLKDAIYIL